MGMKALINPNLYSAHDIWHNVARFYHYVRAIEDGQIMPIWVGTLAKGYGYPLFTFSYHLPWIIGFFFIKLGLSYETAYKLIFFTSYIGSGLSMYILCKKLFKHKLAALTSSIVYLWAPFRFFTVFVSSSIGSAFVFTFLPLVLLGSYIIINDKKKIGGITILSLSLSGMILSHLMSVSMLLPILGLFIIFLLISKKDSPKNKLRILMLLITSGVISVLITAYYIFPLLSKIQLIELSNSSIFTEMFKKNFVNLKQLIYSRWGYGPITFNAKDGEVSFQVGVIQWLAAALLTVSIFIKKKFKFKKISLALIALFSLCIFLMTDKSQFVWNLISKVLDFDYPFRLLIVVVFIGSIIVGLALMILPKKIQVLSSIGFIIIALYTNRNHIKVNMYTDYSIETYVESETTTNTFNEYLPDDVNAKFLNEDHLAFRDKQVIVKNEEQTTNSTIINVSNPSKLDLRTNFVEFPGIVVFVDNVLVDHYGRKGLVRFDLDAGDHTIEIRYIKTIIEKISLLISLLTLLSLSMTNMSNIRKKIL